MTSSFTAALAAHPITDLADDDVLGADDTSATTSGGITAFNLRKYTQRGGGSNMIMVASADASAAVKRRADLVCTNTDDDGDINTALADGSVEMTDGDYVVDEQLFANYPGHTLRGVGRGCDMTGSGAGTIGRGYGTRLYVNTGFADSNVISVGQTGAVLPAGMVTLRDFTIEGNNVGSGICGIDFRSFQGVIDNVMVRRMSGHGCNIHGYSTAEYPPDGWSTYDCMLSKVHFERNGGSGLYLQNGTDIHIVEIVSNTNTESGIRHDGGASIQVVDFHCYGNTLDGIHLDGAGSRNKFTNGKIEHNHRNGFHFDGSSGTGETTVQISDVGFNSNSNILASDNVYDHIRWLGAGSSDRIILNNINLGNSDGSIRKPKYGINISNVAGEFIMGDCFLGRNAGSGGWTTGAFNFTGTADASISNCIGIHDKTPAAGTTTAAFGTGAGTGPTGLTVSGTDHRGQITWTTGTGPTGGTQFVVTYAQPFAIPGSTVIVQGASNVTTALNPKVSANDQTTFTVSFNAAPAASTAYALNYIVVA